MTRRSALVLALSFLGFVGLGLPDGLLGVAWPSMRASFGLRVDALGPLLLAWTSGFVLASFGSGQLLARSRVAAPVALGHAAIAAALLGYSIAPQWWIVLAFAVLGGLGGGAIEAGLNSHVASHHGARALNWLHACWGLGTASAPLLLTQLLAAGHAWQVGYRAVGAWQLATALCFAASLPFWPRAGGAHLGGTPRPASLTGTLRHPPAWLGIAAFFLYTGLEISAGAWVYSLFTEQRGMPAAAAGRWVSGYWASLTVGRLVFGWIAGRTPVAGLLRACTAATTLGAALVALGGSGVASGLGLALLGLSCGPIYPSLIATTRDRVGDPHAANAVGFQVAAGALGVSLLPAALGVLAGRLGLAVVGPALVVEALALFAMHERIAARER